EVSLSDVAQVLDEGRRRDTERFGIAVQPAVAIEAGVEPHNLVPAAMQYGSKARSDVSFGPGNEQLHVLLVLTYGGGAAERPTFSCTPPRETTKWLTRVLLLGPETACSPCDRSNNPGHGT